MLLSASSSVAPPLRRPQIAADDAAPAAVRVWLWSVVGLVLAMVTVGGATRLTGSGLSITEWQPILGAIPPLTAADWQVAFDKYRQITQYKLVNKGMSLEAFQFIYWWEWGHRQLGRFIGVAYALPLVVFLARGMIPARAKPWLFGLLVLGGLQGFMGWYMVQSGLADRIDVSPYRLAMHLTLAAMILAGLVWVAAELAPRRAARLDAMSRGAVRLTGVLVGLVVAQIFLGALVAGLKAGLTYNTWPLMDGRIIPNGLFSMSPWWLNLFENVTTVQFDHRMLAYVIVALALWHGLIGVRGADDVAVRVSGRLVAVTVLAQVTVGIWTLLAVVPLWLGLVHQALAFLLLGLVVWHRHAVVRS